MGRSERGHSAHECWFSEVVVAQRQGISSILVSSRPHARLVLARKAQQILQRFDGCAALFVELVRVLHALRRHLSARTAAIGVSQDGG